MKGERVWMCDHPVYGWTSAVIVSLSSNTNMRLITIKSQDNVERMVDPRSIIKFEEDIIDYNDLVSVHNLHEGIMVHNIWQRFEKRKIYTWIGDILVCVNPIKALPELYTPTMLSSAPSMTSPHIYGTAAKAYLTLVQTSQPQVFLVSGESGSGKTESCKLILQYLVHASSSKTSKPSSSLQNMILASSPILESFGNARTTRNSNSSRFGKFLKIHFDSNGAMLGATISQFLLEKARVVQPPPGELNYSIFYTLVEGCDNACRRALGLNPGVHNYKFLRSSATSVVDPALEVHHFRAVVASFSALGLQQDMPLVFEVLAAILHLGNVEFEPHPHGGSAVVDNRPLQAASLLLLGPSAEKLALEIALTTQLISAGTNRKRSSVTRRLLEPHQSAQSRDALCKALYESLFNHICALINSAMMFNKDANQLDASNRFIGVLDIFGFENMETNRHDQLLINYANEVLQLQFANQVILTEQQEYAKEQVPWTPVDFTSNQPCVDLLEKKPKGILPMLEEECMLPQGSDKRLLQKLHDMHEKSANYTKPRLASDTKFAVGHFAGDVLYDIDGFVAQNRDDIHVDLVQILLTSAKQDVIRLGDRIQANKKLSSGGGISSQFRGSLSSLLKDIGQTQPNHKYYVRCIKPNPNGTSAAFDPLFALRQMKAMGMLESVRVRKMGYSLRVTHQEFIERFACIINTVGITSAPPKTICSQFVAKVLPPDSGQSLCFIGPNKIFLKEKLVSTLEEMRYKAEKKRDEEFRRREEELRKKRAEEERQRLLAEEQVRQQAEIERKKKEEERRKHEEEMKKKKEILLQEEARLKRELKAKEELRMKEELRIKEELRMKEEVKEQQRETTKLKVLETKRSDAKVPYLEAAKRGSLVLDPSEMSHLPDHPTHPTSNPTHPTSHPTHPNSVPLSHPTNQPSYPTNTTTNIAHTNGARHLGDKAYSNETNHLGSQKKLTTDRKGALLAPPSRPSTPNSMNNINININNDYSTPINININIISNKDTPSSRPESPAVNIVQNTLTGTLSELLAMPTFLAPFEEYMKGTADAALIEFWKDIQTYKRVSERLLSGQARGIYNKFFGHGSKFIVNLDRKLLADIKDKIMYRNPEYTTFSKVEADILQCFTSTYIPQFRVSEKAPVFVINADNPSAATATTRISSSTMLPKSQSLSAIATPKMSSSPAILPRNAARVTIGRTPESVNTTDSPKSAHNSVVPKEMTTLEQGVMMFNEAPKKGLEFLFTNGIVQAKAADIGKFLKATPSIDKTVLGDFIGRREELNQQVLVAFLETFEFKGTEFDVALREFLSWFRLPGESQMIERIVEHFAKRYCASNAGHPHLASPEAAFILSYSIIMLATDLHNANVKTKMTREQWIKNNSGCNNGADFDAAFLKKIYERIAKTPFASTAKGSSESPRLSSAAPPRSESKYGLIAIPLLRRGTTKQHVGK